jgi:hypothetical protein
MTISATHVTKKHTFYFWSKCGNPEDYKSYPGTFGDTEEENKI